jgi:hypothetical protein
MPQISHRNRDGVVFHDSKNPTSCRSPAKADNPKIQSLNMTAVSHTAMAIQPIHL